MRVHAHAAGIVAMALVAIVGQSALAARQTTQIPVPRPFPQPGQPTTTTAPAPSTPPVSTTPTRPADPPPASSQPPVNTTPVVTAAPTVRPSERELGVAVYPAAEYIDSYDAGRGQRYYLFGTNAAFADIVGYYKNILRDGGRELFKAPAMQQFDLGRYRDDTMAYPPSVVVKDYTWSIDGQPSAGYLFIDGTKEKHFKTIIQIVPATGK
jgi:hypothetical protein